jgi:cytochrome c peroxidase
MRFALLLLLTSSSAVAQQWEMPPITELSDNEANDERIALGSMLFRDRNLSSNKKVSCLTCHDIFARAGTDGRATSIGVTGVPGRRNAPALVNLGWSRLFMLDGRALQLEGQPQMPLLSAAEHGMTESAIVAYLNSSADYKARFSRAYGEVPSLEGVSKALACFMRELISWNAPIDRYLAGETWALDRQAKLGWAVFLNCTEASGFTTEAKIKCVSSHKGIDYFHRPLPGSCAACHNGPNFAWDADQVHRYHNCAVGVFDLDLGREIIEGADDAAKLRGQRDFRFVDAYKTATLREIRLTAPYFHNGLAATIDDALDMKQRGGDPDIARDKLVYSYKWTKAEREALRYFLLTAFEGDYKQRIAKLGITPGNY